MTVDAIYKICQYIINKNQDGGFSPSEFNLVINAAQREYLDFLIGSLQSFQYGRPIPRVALGQSQNVRTRLTPFVGAPVALVPDGTTGIAPYPDRYIYFDAMYYGSSKMAVKEVQQDRLAGILNSVIDPVATNPIFILVSTGFQFYPATISTPIVSYIKNPPDIVYAFTLDGNNRQVYNSGASVQPLWLDLDIFEVIARALRMIGVNLQAGQVQQFSKEIKEGGQ